jgi:hypothetical protein
MGASVQWSPYSITITGVWMKPAFLHLQEAVISPCASCAVRQQDDLLQGHHEGNFVASSTTATTSQMRR